MKITLLKMNIIFSILGIFITFLTMMLINYLWELLEMLGMGSTLAQRISIYAGVGLSILYPFIYYALIRKKDLTKMASFKKVFIFFLFDIVEMFFLHLGSLVLLLSPDMANFRDGQTALAILIEGWCILPILIIISIILNVQIKKHSPYHEV